LLGAAFYADLSDSQFVSICEEDTPFGWLIPVDRMPESLLKISPNKLAVVAPYGELLEELRHRWYRMDEENTYGGQGDTFWTRSTDGQMARRVPHALGASLYLNQCLTIGAENELLPITDSLQHHRLLLRKYHRAMGDEKVPEFNEISPAALAAAEIEKYVCVALDVMRLFLSDEELRQRSVLELLQYKKNAAEDLARFRLCITKLASSLATQPWDPKFQLEVNHLIDKDLLPEVQKAADGLKGIYEKMFGKIVGAVGQKVLAASTLTLLMSLLPHLALGQIITMGCLSTLAALGLAVPEVTSALQDSRGQKRNSLSFVIGLSDSKRIQNWFTVHHASGIADLLRLRHKFSDVPQEHRQKYARIMLGFSIPDRMESQSVPKDLIPVLHQIESDPDEVYETRSDARMVLELLRDKTMNY
jgi:hypothetical protein